MKQTVKNSNYTANELQEMRNEIINRPNEMNKLIDSLKSLATSRYFSLMWGKEIFEEAFYKCQSAAADGILLEEVSEKVASAIRDVARVPMCLGAEK